MGVSLYLYELRTCGARAEEFDSLQNLRRRVRSKISVRKLYLEPERPDEIVEVEYQLPKNFWDRIKEALGLEVKPRYAVREERRRAPRRWRWQTHAEIEEESGVLRHEDFL